MGNHAPILRGPDTYSVLASESPYARRFVRAVDPDNDSIVRYRIVHRTSATGDRQGQFQLNGQLMPVGQAFVVTAEQFQQLVFQAGSLGHRQNQNASIFVRAFDGSAWSGVKRIELTTLYNRHRPVVAPRHRTTIAQLTRSANTLFVTRDRDGNTIKWFRFRDTSLDPASAYFMLDGVQVNHTNWFAVKADELSRLQVMAGTQNAMDRFGVRAFDGRFWSKTKVSIVKTLARPILAFEPQLIVNELERINLRSLVTSPPAAPGFTQYEFIDLNGDSGSGAIINGYDKFQANRIYRVSSKIFSKLDFIGGTYDSLARDSIMVRGFDGTSWSTWQRMEFHTDPHYEIPHILGRDWTQYLPTPDEGEPLIITYSFLQQVPDYYAGDAAEREGFARLPDATKNKFRALLEQFAEVINVQFVEVSDTAGGEIRIGSNTQDALSPGYAYYPDDPGTLPWGGDIWINNLVDPDEPVDWVFNYAVAAENGNFYYAAMRQLVGFAMGLTTPTSGFPLLPGSSANQKYTVMSGAPDPDNSSLFVQTFATGNQIYDATVLRKLYGANESFHAGDDVHQLPNDKISLETIFDRGGVDWLDASNQTLAAKIDLRPGRYSSIGPGIVGGQSATRNIGIHWDAMIENARGTIRDDRLVGNWLDNELQGLAGDDFLNGLAGNDRLIGGEGDDTYRVGLESGHEVIDDQSDSAGDVLEILTFSSEFNSFTDNLTFRRVGDDLLINLTLADLGNHDLVDASVRIRDMTGTNGVETLRLLGSDESPFEVDVDLTSAFAAADNVHRHMTITADTSTYGNIVAPV